MSRRLTAVLATGALVLALTLAGLATVPRPGGPIAAGAQAAAGTALESAGDDRRAASVPAAVAKVRAARTRLARATQRLRAARADLRAASRGPGRADRVRKARARVQSATQARNRTRVRLRSAENHLRRVRPLGKPNVVLFLLDDMRGDELAHLPRTRKLLAGSGTTFTDVVSAHPLCCPARAQLLTGQYAHNNGVRHNSGARGGYGAYDPSRSLGTSLRAAGYHTALHGKYLNGYTVTRGPSEPGWSTWDTFAGGTYDYRNFSFVNGDRYRRDYVTDRLTERSIGTVRKAADRQAPFFVMVSHPAPHYAWGGGWPGGSSGHHPPPAKPGHLAKYAGTTAPYLRDPAFGEVDLADKPRAWLASEGGSPTRAYIQKQYVHRAAALRSVDDGIAATLAELRRLGELRNTYVVVTSDNGYALGEHAVIGKNVFYDEVLSIPLLVSGPGVRPGSNALPAHLADLSATILDIADAKPSRLLDGRSFLPALGSGAARLASGWRDTTLLIAGTTQGRSAEQWGFHGVRTDRYVYGVSALNPTEQVLLDRVADPHELDSVHADPRYAEIRAELGRRTALLRGCTGAACNVRFGPLPEPRP